MPLSAGTRLGPYEILAPLGAGGMGEVYRARDTRLHRDVAIKIAAEQFTERFEREARAVAALNHPNICTLFDVGPNYLVMELVEGPALAERIAAGPIALGEALVIARQMAEALEAAHEKGITHRDLKPANVKLTADGNVKVLDFGLAKTSGTDTAAAGNPATSPTLTISATRAGVILGTAAYMSPEQARGSPVDKRADIWAFGVVLYEMLTGRHLFAGETVSDTLAAVLKTDPDWSALPAETPQPIRRLLRRCLQRDRKRRLPDIADARLEIDEALAGSPETSAASARPEARGVFRWWNLALALVALAGVVVAFVHFREQAPERAVVRFQIPAPDKTNFGSIMCISPNGHRLVFTATNAEGQQMLWVRGLDSPELQALTGTEGANFPFWSPDSRFIAFSVQGKLKKIEASGGAPQTISDVQMPGGSWGRDGTILFGTTSTGLFRVSQTGGTPSPVTTPEASLGEVGHIRPWFLPDGTHFLYFALNIAPEKNAIYLGVLNSKDRKRLVFSRQAAVYAPLSAASDQGHLFFLREATLMAQPLDPRRFDLEGEAFPVAEHVGSLRYVGFFSVSGNGVLAYRSGASADIGRLAWLDRQGKPLGFLGPPSFYYDVALSPDGSRAAVARDDPQSSNRDIWIMDVARNFPRRFTFDPAREPEAVWSPDGKRIVFSSYRNGPAGPDMYEKDSAGAGNEELLLKIGIPVHPKDWSLDGRYVLYNTINPKTQSDIWTLPVGEVPAGRKPELYLETPFNESQGQFSPDGHWVAYTSDVSGAVNQVYVQSFPVGAGTFQISTGGGVQPRWRRDGQELFYIAADGKLMAVEVKTSPHFETGTPKALFDPRMGGGPLNTNFRYAVTADGKRFLVITAGDPAATSVSSPITIVLNWTAGLKP